MESMVPVCDKRYHIYNRFRHFGAEIKKLWNYLLYEVLVCNQFLTKVISSLINVKLLVSALFLLFVIS